ncbi:MAG TPA: sulfite oxidase, partial [Rubrobacter sp.]|nr:sulfite oxidase [Rubrobacter sp.]
MESTVRANAATPIIKPLPPEEFVDFADGEHGYNAETRWEALAKTGYLTPNDRFFIRSHAATPRLDAASWRLRVDGPGVERPLEIGYDAVLRLPAVTLTRALECAGNGRAFFAERQGREAPGTPWRLGAIGVAEWTGAPLREVLERAGIKASARDVMAESLDGVRMRRPLPVEKAMDDALLVYAMNGETLPPDHGFPVRLLVPGWAAVASVKWLGRLHVAERRLYSPWNTEDYVLTGGRSGQSRVPLTSQGIKSALELPWPARLERGRHVVRGRSWSGAGSISRVEYRIGEGEWRIARIFGPNVPGAWARWSFLWDASPGRHEVRVRATDEAGNVQPDEVEWNDLGYLYDGVV